MPVSGQERWQRSLGKPVPSSSLPCGNISPLGVTGTPVIDAAREAIYLDAAVQSTSGPRHFIFGLSLKDGTPLSGWPVDVMEALGNQGQTFVARDQNQRGALTLLAGNLYVPFGGHFGDCGQYRGFVVGISLSDPRTIKSWATRARGGGIWAPGGISTDGTSLFVATGNTFGARTWSDGEAVIRLAPDLHRSDDKRNFFAPSDWAALDARDADLGASNPLLLEASGGPPLILALGKDRKAYLLDRNNLGGIGGQLAMETVSDRAIITAPVTYPAADGIFVALQAEGTRCPTAARGLLTLKIRPGLPSAIATAWCGSVRGRGAPIVTTTDGHSNAIVWIVGAEGDNQLHGFRGDTADASRENDHAPSARSSSVEVRGGVPIREIARRIGVAASTVRATIKRFQATGLSWPLPEEMTDAMLEARLFPDAGTKQGHRRQVEPDWAGTMTGMFRVRGSFLRLRTGSQRSMTGISRSIRITSGCSVASARRPAAASKLTAVCSLAAPASPFPCWFMST